MISFARVCITPAALWLTAIPYEEWPQQHRSELRPAMVTDLAWHEFGAATDSIEREIIAHFPDCVSTWRALSVVMPGHAIATHSDAQRNSWVCRVHVPLLTNDQAFYISDERVHRMAAGQAYRIDTREPHSVVNGGLTPRVHLMIDIGRA